MIVLASICTVAFVAALGYVCNEVRITVGVIRGEAVLPLGLLLRRSIEKAPFRAYKMGNRS